MARGMIIISQQDGRQPILPASVVTVETAPLQQGNKGATSRTTRAAGGLYTKQINSIIVIISFCVQICF